MHFRDIIEKLTTSNTLHDFPLIELSEFLGADAASLWFWDRDTDDEVVFQKSHRMDRLEEDLEDKSFEVSDANFIKYILDKKKLFLEFDSNGEIFGLQRRNWIFEEIIKFRKKMIIMIICDDAGNVSCIVSLHADQFQRSVEIDDITNHICRVLGNNISNLYDETRRILKERHKIGHEMARQVSNSKRKVEDLLKSSTLDKNARLAIDGVLLGLNSAIEAAGRSTFLDGVLERVPTAPFNKLRRLFNGSAHLAIAKYRRHEIKFNSLTTAEHRLALKISRIDLDLLFSNLIDNAAKYSVKHGTILSNWTTSDEGGVLKVSNISLPLNKTDLEMIWRLGIRGSNIGDKKGEGTGLSIISDICGAYDLKPKLWQEISGDRCWTHVSIAFPRSRLSR